MEDVAWLRSLLATTEAAAEQARQTNDPFIEPLRDDLDAFKAELVQRIEEAERLAQGDADTLVP